MPTLKPIDHQNIVLRLLGMSSSNPAHLTTLAHAYKLPVSLHEIRVACDALVEQEFVERAPGFAYRLTAFGTVELPAVPLLESYYTAPSKDAVTEAAWPDDGVRHETKLTKEDVCRMFDVPLHLFEHIEDRTFSEGEIVEFRAMLERGFDS